MLLIAAALAPADLRYLRVVAAALGLAVLVEVHDIRELDAALDAGAEIVGIDRSEPMLSRARHQITHSRSQKRTGGPRLVRGDIRALPFQARMFSMVLAPYGVLQSLLAERDLAATLESVGRVLAPGGTFGIDLVPDVPNWREYENRVQHRGRATG